MNKYRFISFPLIKSGFVQSFSIPSVRNNVTRRLDLSSQYSSMARSPLQIIESIGRDHEDLLHSYLGHVDYHPQNDLSST